MSPTTVDYHVVGSVNDAMHFLREPLAGERLVLTVVECPPGWRGKEHDHADRGHEEVHLVVDGAVTVAVEDDRVPLEAGDALRLDPTSTRQIRTGDEPSTLVVAGAP